MAESTCQDLTIAGLLGPGGIAELDKRDLGYATSMGDVELRDLLAASLDVSPDDVLVTAGAASALFLTALVLADTGDVAVVTPCFPPTLDALRGLGASVTTVRARFDDGYRIDPAAVERALSADTRLVVLTSPQNPSGVRMSSAEVEQVLAAMSRSCPDAWLLVDETFRHAVYGETSVPPSFAALSSRVLTCGSLSKAHGAPGVRIGWLTAGSAELYEQFRLAKFNSSLACGRLDELLAVELLRRADTVLAPRRARLVEALPVVEEFVYQHRDRIDWVRPDAGAFCCVRLDTDRFGPDDVERFYAMLDERRVAVAHGAWFGDSDHVFRLGFGNEPVDTLRAGLRQLGGVVDAL